MGPPELQLIWKVGMHGGVIKGPTCQPPRGNTGQEATLGGRPKCKYIQNGQISRFDDVGKVQAKAEQAKHYETTLKPIYIGCIVVKQCRSEDSRCDMITS
ncbi:hypothetical protein BIFBRE_05076 [Bifidobacterium breve DSM 20213 = JCM 1192]|uniref:Uncharacterized protein n=1 Tax=Bifidobacterium breve DSM 20213 = JCM 1192 TaxID=518634 RepID=D4BSI4_BIFBR|nr:hypothetical protein BIFBRE_05076 [Bifidobacterium breve DSM 20213 = JCM 1192]